MTNILFSNSYLFTLLSMSKLITPNKGRIKRWMENFVIGNSVCISLRGNQTDPTKCNLPYALDQ